MIDERYLVRLVLAGVVCGAGVTGITTARAQRSTTLNTTGTTGQGTTGQGTTGPGTAGPGTTGSITVVTDPTAIGSMAAHNSGSSDDAAFSFESLSMLAQRDRLQKKQRKERLTASADRLLELTKEFEAQVATHDVLTADDEKRLDEIAKMAREVRSRMVN